MKPPVAVHPLLLFGRGRRTWAEAHGRWCNQRDGRSMPTTAALAERSRDNLEPGVLTLTLGKEEVLKDADDPRATDGLQADDRDIRAALRRMIARAAPAIAGARAPLSFRAELLVREQLTRCDGIILPYRGRQDEVAALRVAFEVVGIAAPDDLRPAIDGAVAAVTGSTAPDARSPWSIPARRGSWPLATEPVSSGARLAAARTWAALAVASLPRRGERLHAALGAVYAASHRTALKVEEDAAARDGCIHAALTTVFAEYPAAEQEVFALALSHATRLGLAPDGLAAALDRAPAGARGFAEAERRARAGSPPPPALAEERLALAPFPERLSARRRTDEASARSRRAA